MQLILPFGTGQVEIEYRWVQGPQDRPLMIFLHEGLGSVATWKDYPDLLCTALQLRGLVYSRPGYGQSSMRREGESWGVDYLHRQALELLPSLLQALSLEHQRPVLFGHSDGASIALIHAAHHSSQLSGVIVLAPHVLVEQESVEAIRATCDAYRKGDLRARLARYHSNPDSPFFGWSEAWLDPAFRSWNIEALLSQISCPLLAIQGWQDEYASMLQLDRIAAALPHARLLKLEHCGHTPFRDQPENVRVAVEAFLRSASTMAQVF